MEPGAESDVGVSAPEMDIPLPPPSEPGEDAPQEVEQDVIAELDRIHDAQRFVATPPADEFDDSYGIQGYQSPSAAMRYEPPVVAPREPEEPAAPIARELHTLEDLYAAYPEVGGGSFYLRVHRKHPTTYGGLRCAGFIDDVHEQLSMREFVSRFGGHVYEVMVRGPGPRSSTIGPDGKTQVRTLTKIRLEVPGPPILNSHGSNGQDMTQQHNPPGFFGDDPRVQMKRLDLEAEDRRRREKREDEMRRQALEQSQLNPNLFSEFERIASARSDDVRSASQEVIHQLKQTQNRLATRCESLEQKNQELREKMAEQQMTMTMRLKEEESRQVRELKERHADEIRRIKEDQASTITRMESEHRRSVQDITESAQRERDQLQKMEQMERDRIRNDAQRREESLLNEHSRRERETRETFESRMKELERSHDREMRGVREMRDREIESIRTSEKSHSKLSEKTAEVQVTVMQGEIARLTASNEALGRENEALRAQINKPPLEAVREAHEIASMTGYKGDSGEEEFDWKKGAVATIKNLIDKAPEIAQGLGNAREQNRIAVAQAQHRARVAQARAAHAQQRRQMAAAPQMAPAPPPSRPQAASSSASPQHRPPPPPGMAPQRAWDDPVGPPAPDAPVGPPTAGVPVPEPADPVPPPLDAGAPPAPQGVPLGAGAPTPNFTASMAERPAEQPIEPHAAEVDMSPVPEHDDEAADDEVQVTPE